MSTISQVTASAVSSTYDTSQTKNKSKVSGKTIGEPQLTDKAQKYYEELKKKYSNMDFILVSKDKKAQAQSQAGSFANAHRMVVLIDDEKIERMAEDKNYRNQYEKIIQSAALQMPQIQSSLASTSANVKGYGMQVNSNGTASFFAVIDKSLATQKERIEKKAAEKKEAKKTADKKAAKEKQQERLEKSKADRLDKTEPSEDTVTITASSIEELIQKINDTIYAGMSDRVRTEEEKMVGQHINFGA